LFAKFGEKKGREKEESGSKGGNVVREWRLVLVEEEQTGHKKGVRDDISRL